MGIFSAGIGVCVGNGFIRSVGDHCGMHKCIPYGGGAIGVRNAGCQGLPYGPLQRQKEVLPRLSAAAPLQRVKKPKLHTIRIFIQQV